MLNNKFTTEKINEILGVDDSWKAPDRLMEILFDRDKRESVFREFLKIDSDVSYDWFHMYFQDEAADRNKKKQDFTPKSVSRVLSKLVGDGPGMKYDSASGTGGLTIQTWWDDCLKDSFMLHKPSNYIYFCEELSDRALPFLLFNLLIRGTNAVVVQCDILSRKAKGAFFIQNDNDDTLQFSSLNVMPYSEDVANFLSVTWTDFRYQSYIESQDIPNHILNTEVYKAMTKGTDNVANISN